MGKRSEYQKKERIKKQAYKQKHSFYWKHIHFFHVLYGTIVSIIGISSIIVLALIINFYPRTETLKINSINKPIVQSLTIRDVNGSILQQNRKVIKYDPVKLDKTDQNVDDLYKYGLVITEDNSYYKRWTHGYSIKDTAGAMLSQIKGKLHHNYTNTRGASTIEQQLVKMIVMGEGNANTVSDKLIQIIDAYNLSHRYSKDDILKAYMNSLRLTPSTLGVKAASIQLFNNDLKHIDRDNPKQVAETAFMVGLGKAPYTYVNDFNKSGKQRTMTVLNLMLNNRLLSHEQYENAIKFVKSDKFQLYGLKVKGSPKAYQSYISLVYKEMNDIEAPDNAKVDITTYTTKNKLNQMYKVLKGKSTSYYGSFIPKHNLNAISAVDTKTGHVIGISTNSNNPQIPFNAVRSSGSVIKPMLDYGPALEYGKIGEFTALPGSEFTVGNWRVVNFGNQNVGPISAAKALGLSLNTAAVHAFMLTNQNEKLSIMQPLGLAKYNQYKKFHVEQAIDYPSNTLCIANAYASIGNDGIYNTPTAIKSVKINNNSIKLKQYQSTRAMSSNTAKTLVSMLHNVTTQGGSEPLMSPNSVNLPASKYAMKSGTSNFARHIPGSYNSAPDYWLAMTTPKVSVAVWTGSPSYTSTKGAVFEGNNLRESMMKNCINIFIPNHKLPKFTWSGIPMTKEQKISNVPNIKKGYPTDFSYSDFEPKNKVVSKKQLKENKKLLKEYQKQIPFINKIYIK